MARYLVIFTTPAQVGRATIYEPRLAIVEDDNMEMPFGWRPDEIAGLPVGEINYIIEMPETGDLPMIVNANYDEDVEFGEGMLDIPPNRDGN